MRFNFALAFAAIGVMAGTALGQSAEAGQRITLKLTLGDGKQVQVTGVEGQIAEIKQAGSSGFHWGLVPTRSEQLVAVQIIELGDGSRKPLAKVTGPIGEQMEVRIGGKPTDPPTLRIVPEKVY